MLNAYKLGIAGLIKLNAKFSILGKLTLFPLLVALYSAYSLLKVSWIAFWMLFAKIISFSLFSISFLFLSEPKSESYFYSSIWLFLVLLVKFLFNLMDPLNFNGEKIRVF